MTNRSNITTGKPPNCGIPCRLGVILLIIVAWVPAFAHGGFEHVRGTVVKVANNVLTIKTAKGNVDVLASVHFPKSPSNVRNRAYLPEVRPDRRPLARHLSPRRFGLDLTLSLSEGTAAASNIVPDRVRLRM